MLFRSRTGPCYGETQHRSIRLPLPIPLYLACAPSLVPSPEATGHPLLTRPPGCLVPTCLLMARSTAPSSSPMARILQAILPVSIRRIRKYFPQGAAASEMARLAAMAQSKYISRGASMCLSPQPVSLLPGPLLFLIASHSSHHGASLPRD